MSSTVTTPTSAPSVGDWADPGFYSKRVGRGETFWRLVWFMVAPPQRPRFVPTPAGYVLILVALGLGSAAYNTSSNILFMALSLLLSSLILSGFLSLMNFRGIHWRLRQPPHFRAGDPALLQLELNNTKKLLPTYSLWFNVASERSKSPQRVHLEDRLNPGKQASLDWEYTPQKRGLEKLTISGLESQFPFGFLRKTIGGGLEKDVIVLPKRVEYTFQPPGGHHSHLQGETNRRPGGGNELINIRRYQQGDAQRLVHWKASARQRQLLVRQMAEENRDGYVLFVESPKALWSDEAQFEQFCSYAASLSEDLFREGQLLGYAVNDEPVQPLKRLHDLQVFLERLALLERVDQYVAMPDSGGRNLITFRPGLGGEVYAYLGGNIAGSVER